MEVVFDVAFRSLVIYLVIIIGIRLFGKKELAQLSVIDLVFILLISNAVQNAMVGNNTSILSGVVAAGTLFLLNALLKILFFKSPRLNRIFQGSPLMLIYKGRVIEKHLKSARITHDELHEAIREHGVKNIKDVDLAVLETDGNISVLSGNFHKKSVKRRKSHKIISKSFGA